MFNNINNEKLFRNKITLIHFICCVMVVYIHTYNLKVYEIDGGGWINSIEKVFSIVNSTAVPSFFFISGMLFFRNFKIDNLFSKWKRRLKSIVIPYVIWCILYYLYYLIISNAFSSITIEGIGHVSLDLMDFFGFLFGGVYCHLWFLQNLMLFIILAPIEWYLLKNKKIKTGTIIIVALSIIEVLFPKLLPKGMLMYLYGSYISLNKPDLMCYKNRTLSIFCIALVFLSLITLNIWSNNIIMVIYTISLWYVIDLFRLENTNLPGWMSITFFIYVAHVAVLEPIEKIILILFGRNPVFALIDYVFAPILTILMLVLIAYCLKRYTPKLWTILNGCR